MAFNFVYLAGEYHVGLSEAISADNVLGSKVLRAEPAFTYKGDTVEIPKIHFAVAMADNASDGTAGVSPGSDSSDVIAVTTRRLDGAIDIETGRWNKHLGWATNADRDKAMARSFARKARAAVLAGVMVKLAAVATDYASMVTDITGAAQTADRALGTMSGKAARAIILAAKGKHGVYQGGVVGLIVHPDIHSVLKTLSNDAGVPYYTENSRGELVVEGAVVLPCDVGTKDNSTYLSFFCRADAVVMGRETPAHYAAEGELAGVEDLQGPVKVATIPTDASSTEKYRFTLKSWYFAHVYSTTDGADKVGVSILKSLG